MTPADPLAFLRQRPQPALIAMIHVGALPGTPRHDQSIAELTRTAVDEARIYAAAGVDAILLENMHDLPYLNRRVGPEIVASMTAICAAVRAAVALPMGVQILAGANRAAIAVAYATGCAFVRCEGFVFGHVADEGMMNADAGRLLRFRRAIGADHLAILADVKKKHASHALTADIDIADTARAAEWCGAAGVIVTGTATGLPTDPAEVQRVKSAVNLPILVGSGVTPDNVAAVARHADGLIVGSFFKRNGQWHESVDAARVEALLRALS